MITANFIKLYETSFKENWDLEALTDINEKTSLTYGALAAKIARLHILFEEIGIMKGDKVALIGTNHSSWALVFMATITYGAVIVPILSDFHPDSMENIILHSDSKISFIDQGIWKNINKERISHPVFSLPSLQIIQGETNELRNLQLIVDEKFSSKYLNGFQAGDIIYPQIYNESVVCINYISGTSTFTRGVMLTGNNFAGNMESIQKLNLIFKGEKNVVFLPMAHAFSCALDFLYALSIGVHIHLLSKIRNTQMLLDAFHEIKPNLISTVPLILEKIYLKTKEKIMSKSSLRFYLKVPILNKFAHRKIRKYLTATFGGNFREVMVGGAIFSEEAECFLHKIKFPFSVGYGMTECGPFISYIGHKDFIHRSCGKVPELMKARIDSEDPHNIPGEIQVKGAHVMAGYYRNPEATAAAFTEDGWLRTGDLGIIDKEGRLFIKGLIKNMILGSNGQNVYPKGIESQLNKMPFISESLVEGKNNRLMAYVYPNFDEMKKQNVSIEDLVKIMNDNRLELNKNVAKYERLGSIEIKLN